MVERKLREFSMKALPVRGCVVDALAYANSAEGQPLQHGVASYCGPGIHGRRTASGEQFNSHALTAAHKTLPFGSRVRVTNERTGRSVVVRINDRGPYAHGRVIDLSTAAAQAVGHSGMGKVSLAKL